MTIHIKSARVSNPKNVLVQVPGWIAAKWSLKKNDVLEVFLDDGEQCIIIRPKDTQAGSNAN